MEALLKDRSDPDGHSDSLYQVLTLTARLIRRLSERRKRSWRLLWKPISGPHPDD